MGALDDLTAYSDARGEHLSREEFDANDPQLMAMVLAALREEGVDEVDLDELVYEACMELATVEANFAANSTSADLELVSGEELASRANNGGLSSQVEMLSRVHGNGGMVQRLLAVLQPAAPRP